MIHEPSCLEIAYRVRVVTKIASRAIDLLLIKGSDSAKVCEYRREVGVVLLQLEQMIITSV